MEMQKLCIIQLNTWVLFLENILSRVDRSCQAVL